MPSYKKSVLKQRKSKEVTCATFTSEFAANKLLQFITEGQKIEFRCSNITFHKTLTNQLVYVLNFFCR